MDLYELRWGTELYNIFYAAFFNAKLTASRAAAEALKLRQEDPVSLGRLIPKGQGSTHHAEPQCGRRDVWLMFCPAQGCERKVSRGKR